TNKMNHSQHAPLMENLRQAYRERFGETLTLGAIEPLGGGSISRAMRLSTSRGPLLLKWKHNGPPDLFEREAESLLELRKNPNPYLHIPEPLLWKSIGTEPGFLLTDYLEPGHTPREDENLGRGLAVLHQVYNDCFGFFSANYCGETRQDNTFQTDWIPFYREKRIGHLIRQIEQYRDWNTADGKLLERFLANATQWIGHRPKPSLIHGDLWSGNFLYTRNGPALIDPCVSYSDREFEMGIMTMFGGFAPPVYEAYCETNPFPDGWKERNLIYQLYHVLNHYLLFGGHYKMQALGILKRFV
ncbi:MAG TPA: fructosamine kinase family protein, partial [Prolixibacteraceae bacterium]|nr:fructosamine kinase family protein [Prolixibacteraceae bacterium]